MRFGLWLVLLLVAGALLAHWLLQDRGYVLIQFRGYAIEMSLPILLLFAALGYLALRLLARLARTPRRLGEAAGRLRVRRIHERFVRGLIELEEGNLSKGERLLIRGAGDSDVPLLSYLMAARAAQRQGAYERRDRWLRMAYERTPRASTAVLLTQAELQLAHEQYEQALATLRKLEQVAPAHVRGLALLARTYEALGDWPRLLELLPRLRRRKALPPEELERLAVASHRASLEKAAERRDLDALRARWRRVPGALRGRAELLACHTRGLAAAGAAEEAERLIRKALATRWEDELVELYGQIETDDPAAQLLHAEGWLKERGEDAALLLACGRLCLRGELWGKARSYLEASLSLRPSAESYQLYGRLLEHLGEADRAASAFREGLSLVAAPPGLPALERPQSPRRQPLREASPRAERGAAEPS